MTKRKVKTIRTKLEFKPAIIKKTNVVLRTVFVNYLDKYGRETGSALLPLAGHVDPVCMTSKENRNIEVLVETYEGLKPGYGIPCGARLSPGVVIADYTYSRYNKKAREKLYSLE